MLIVSNRLPLQVRIEKKNDFEVIPSVGGLATGMKSVHQAGPGKWIGWTGITEEEFTPQLDKKVSAAIAREGCVGVPLTASDIELYYYGFSNKTIWPLFHYFTEFTEYNVDTWETYVRVNQKFAEVVALNLNKGDKVWIHDYQLLLLPGLIRKEFPDVSIGFFLHIPFPSSEVFRILPWRSEILEGILGADLIGFHTYDYQRHFLSSVRRILGYEISFNRIFAGNHLVMSDSFPMGIDFGKFHAASVKQQNRPARQISVLRQSFDKHSENTSNAKLILSIDRLDYTKGIANRLYAFERFLRKCPEFKERVSLVMLCVPSRSTVERYQQMKKEVDELVGRINGEYSTVNWTPIMYFYRSMPFEDLVDLYRTCDIALITPIRDGMNLVAKEYVACRVDRKGVLILSELAGAAQEMSEAILINPNNVDEIADAIRSAILMDADEQTERMATMRDRLRRYSLQKWASDFVNALEAAGKLQASQNAKIMNGEIRLALLEQYAEAQKRILFLDYDGTLVGFKKNPQHARPDEELYAILDALQDNPRNEVVIISGRDRATLEKWFIGRDYSLIVEHGVWMKVPGDEWKLIDVMKNEWKETIRPVMEVFVDRTPGSFIEEKNFSLVWHYRKADPELGKVRSNEIKEDLTGLIANNNLEIMEGNKVIEVKNAGVNKGRAALKRLAQDSYDFILGIGDDWTDEYLFEELPKEAHTIRVGLEGTSAKFNVESYIKVRELLREFGESSSIS